MNSICLKLALQNIRKNKNVFIPFGITCATLTLMYFILHLLTMNTQNDAFRGAYFVKDILGIGLWVIGIIAVLITIYINSFIMKQRTREFGLYSVLGLEKRHIRRILSFEIFFIGIFCSAVGIGLGALFGRLMYLLMLNIIGMNVNIPYVISIDSIGKTLALFGLIYLAVIVMNNIRIFRMKIIDMLHSSRQGEKEPKLRIITAILGFVLLGLGYYFAVVTKDPVKTVYMFLIAVILVILGTYLIFMSGSIAFLKILKKNKKYYYHKTHFITVSGMMYRMKQNAAGLATISILSTMVLVTLSTTISLYIGILQDMKERWPKDFACTIELMPEEMYSEEDAEHYDADKVIDIIRKTAKENNIGIGEMTESDNFEVIAHIGDTLTNYFLNDEYAASVYGLTYDDYMKSGYQRVFQLDEPSEGEVIMITDNQYFYTSLEKQIAAKGLKVTYLDHKVPEKLQSETAERLGFPTVFLLARDVKSLNTICTALPRITNAGDKMFYNVYHTIQFDLDDENECEILKEKLTQKYAESALWLSATYTYYQEQLTDSLQMYGSIFFIGIVLGIIFLLVTVLIIYYKQITEGYDDRRRFIIMENVGMSKQEVKKVIRNQILTVFFMPILVAVVHIVFAFSMIEVILTLIGLVNVNLFIICTVATVVVFAIIYAFVYLSTAKVYYRIVNSAS